MKSKYLLYTILVMALIVILPTNSFAQSSTNDPDNDRVYGSDDRCPNDAGPASNYGCPIPGSTTDNSGNTSTRRGSSSGGAQTTDDSTRPPDSDGDGTADPADRCPNEPGDGANWGCPEGRTGETGETDSEDSDRTENRPSVLIPIPQDDEDCLVASASSSRIRIREYPSLDAPVVGVLNPNDMLIIIGTYYPEADTGHTAWYLVQAGETTGWISSTVVRVGGTCGGFSQAAARREPYLRVKVDDVVVHGISRANLPDDVIVDGGIVTGGIYNLDPDDILIGDIVLHTGGDIPPGDSISLNFGKIKWFAPENSPGDVFFDIFVDLGEEADGGGTDVIFGGLGQDFARGGSGLDILIGGRGNDNANATGGEGNDLLIGGDGVDVLREHISLNYTKIEFFYPNSAGGDSFFDIFVDISDVEVDGIDDLFAPDDGCEIRNPEAGVYIVDCGEDDDSTTMTYCVIEEVGEAGIFEEVCYEVELPDGCTLTSAEAGVWQIECDEGDTVSVNPDLDTLPDLTIQFDPDGVYIGLLLPAVQAKRATE